MNNPRAPTPPRLTDSFPQMSPAACKAVFQRLSVSTDYEARASAIEELLKHQPILNYAYDSGQTFWRARRMEETKRFEHDQEMLWPRTASGAGRAHRPGTTMLYVAAKQDTALAECDASPGDMFQIVGVKIKPRAQARLIPLGEIFQVQRTGISLTGSTSHAGCVGRLLNVSSRRSAEGIVYVDAFLDDEFSKPCNYDLTGLLADRLLGSVKGADGILYLSVKQKGGRNVALKTTAFTERWDVVACSVVRVRDTLGFGMFAIDYVAHATGIFNDGHFRWREDAPSQNSHFEWSY